MDGRKARELAAEILKVGEGRVIILPEGLAKVAEAMTKDDIRTLIGERMIKKRPSAEQSRGRARELKAMRLKGRRRGHGKRSATKKRRMEQKSRWMNRVRSQRRTLRELRESNKEGVEAAGYSNVYRKINGNYFRGKKHLVEFVEGAKK